MKNKNILKQPFTGNIDDLLANVMKASDTDIAEVDGSHKMTHDEAVEYVMDEFQLSKEKAEELVTEIQIKEFERIADGLVTKGVLEVTKYNPDGSKEYGIVGDEN